MSIGRVDEIGSLPASMARFALALATLALAGLSSPAFAGPAPAPAAKAGADTVVLVVRHAEKVVPAGLLGSFKPDEDPPLTAAGQARASSLADALADAGVAAIYSTPLRRTRQTAAPLAARNGVEITTYDPHTPAGELARRILREHRGRTILVVGHSNTVPDIVAALAGTRVERMEDNTYGRLYLVAIDAKGAARLLRLGFPPARSGSHP